MLTGVRKLTNTRDLRLPATKDILQNLMQAVLHTSESHCMKCIIRAMFSLSFFALLRVGELQLVLGWTVLRWCKLDTRYNKSQSFRIGTATTAASLGATDAQIEDMGRWNHHYFVEFMLSFDLVGMLLKSS